MNDEVFKKMAFKKWKTQNNPLFGLPSVRVRVGQICKLEQHVSYFNHLISNCFLALSFCVQAVSKVLHSSMILTLKIVISKNFTVRYELLELQLPIPSKILQIFRADIASDVFLLFHFFMHPVAVDICVICSFIWQILQ